MKILLNNDPVSFEGDSLSIAEIIQSKGYLFPLLVTKLNGSLINESERASTYVHEGDDLLIIHMISGG